MFTEQHAMLLGAALTVLTFLGIVLSVPYWGALDRLVR
jgi:hypothetical protein